LKVRVLYFQIFFFDPEMVLPTSSITFAQATGHEEFIQQALPGGLSGFAESHRF